MKNNKNSINKDIRSIEDLILENEALQEHIDFLENELLHYKAKSLAMAQRCRDLSQANMEMESQIADLKFTRKYLTSEEAGRAFARELLGKPMTDTDISEERFQENGVKTTIGDDY